MKSTTVLRTMVAAAAMVAGAAVGSAQTMLAEIPFAFEAGGAKMNPGSYQVRMIAGGRAILRISDVERRHSALAVPLVTDSVSRPRGSEPILSFQCGEGRCTLAGLWDGSTTSYTFAPWKSAGTQMAMVHLTNASNR